MSANLDAMLGPSERTDWNTPAALLAVARELGPIALDPCSNAESIVHASEEWTGPPRGRDGLVEPWGGRGLVFVNPPYGAALPPWARKIAVEGASGVEVVALLPARTDTAWFHQRIAKAAICFWRGRLTFLGAPHPAPVPSAVAYRGPQVRAFARIFRRHGAVWS